MPDTLLLNSTAQPVSLVPLSTIDWQSAIKYIWLDKVKVLHEYENWEVKSPSTSFRVPAVIMLNEFWKPKSNIRFNRRWVFLRDNYSCQYCFKELHARECTIDHVVPMSKGGKTEWHNVVTACSGCNSSKGSNSKIKPKKLPTEPTYWNLVTNNLQRNYRVAHPSWNYYISNV
jgi:5-methylcytosine-specific restriction endonuclease McrA